ncbi:hypothetical protein BKA70DRAFT_1520408 [Coprinopsis sp. MPI-PUGE-AT-0042]|nr:hypothetical protein BKA70DRAFT_1520408 [Coprinopsis sp. MPI-PUGE-AT-0042]
MMQLKVLKVLKALWWSAALAEIASIFLLASDSTQLLDYLHFNGGDLEALDSSFTFLSGAFMAVAGAVGRVLCYRTLGKFFTFEMSIKKDHGLIKTGPYSIVRHPSYTALALNCLGMLLVFVCPGSWTRESGVLNTTLGRLVVSWVCIIYPSITIALLQRLPEEEAALSKISGREWEQWKKEVPYKLIPFIY